MDLEKTLQHFCDRKGWTLTKLARASGVPKATLHGWTTGRSSLNIDQLKLVASTLEVSLHELAYGVPDPYEAPAHEILKELFTGDVRVSIHRIERKAPKKLK